MSLLADLKKHFDCANLYEALHLDPKKKATYSAEAIKKAYYKQSLSWHPDRLAADVSEEDKKEATEKFQVISGVYAVLGDEEKRKIYDETGVVDSEDWGEDGANWATVWRTAYKKVTIEEIENFLRNYVGSDEEREDIREAYEKSKGRRNEILERVIGSDADGAPERIFKIIEEMIEAEEVSKYTAFSRAAKKPNAARKKKEAKEAEEMLKKIQEKEGASGEGDLASMILARQQKRSAGASSFLDGLAAKYGGGEGSSEPQRKKKRTAKKTK
uniref:J domain-containing protein n=1 Tax=Steinernema glaseri TaxID=37863 RepID=A0A1I7Z0J3_9BILA